jgi:hypothetical protein
MATMIDSASFAMVDTLTRRDAERHPVWSHYDETAHRDLILSWGVSPTQLDAEIERFEYCGTQPLYPVLVLDPLPRLEHPIMVARFVAASGSKLMGYLLEPHAFGLFVGDREFCFNRRLVSAAIIAERKLSLALGEPADGLFPMDYSTGLRAHDGRVLDGRIQRYW